MKKKLLVMLSMLSILSAVSADSIVLNNGKTMEGTFIGREGDNIKFEVDGISMTFQASDVSSINMGSAAKTENNASAGNAGGENNKVAEDAATIASGSKITIRLSEALNSGKHSTGQKFSGVLEGALVSNGVTVAAAGSKVYGVVVEAEKSGRLAGKSKMLITITSININGQIVPVVTDSVNAVAAPTGAASAGKVVRGAAIGGLVDGSDGAETGAKIGLGAAILSGGKQVVIPPGTLLDFKLTQPLTSP